MAATIASNSNPQLPTESKSARKKKSSKAEAAASSPAPASDRADSTTGLDANAKSNGAEGAYESPYIKEMQKHIRSVNKKLNLMQKVDKIIDDHKDKSLEELVDLKLINADQKAQALKKPALQSQLASLEEQISHYKKFDAEYQQAMAKERDLLKSSYAKELDDMREITRKEAKIEMEREFKRRMLTFARFLKAAAERRQKEETDLGEEGKAFEGVLYGVYTGDAAAVDCAEKLISGADEEVVDYSGVINVTYRRVKQLSLEEAPVPDDDPWSTESNIPSETTLQTDATAGHTDPTVVNAGLTELDTPPIRIPNGSNQSPELDTPSAPPTASIQEDAGNAAAEEQWDTKAPGEAGMEESFEIIPRDPAETENREAHVIAPLTSTRSWADDMPTSAEKSWSPEPTTGAAPPTQSGTTTNGNDGFHEVHHHRGGRGRGGFGGERGGFRGRGGQRGGEGFRGGRGSRGDGYRGRGRGDGQFRGDGRGRGRGPRGPRGDAS